MTGSIDQSNQIFLVALFELILRLCVIWVRTDIQNLKGINFMHSVDKVESYQLLYKSEAKMRLFQ